MSITRDTMREQLTNAIYTVVMEAPNGDFSQAAGDIEELSGVNGVTITERANGATHYLYLSNADYFGDAASFLQTGVSSYADQWAVPNKPLLLFYDDNGPESGLRLYSELSESGERTLISEAGASDWNDLGL